MLKTNKYHSLILCIGLSFVMGGNLSAQVSEEWVERYDGPAHGEDTVTAIVLDDLDCIYVTGCSEGIGTGLDYATIKYTPDRFKPWTMTYPDGAARYDGLDESSDRYSDEETSKEDRPSSIDYSIIYRPSGTGAVYVTGRSKGRTTHYDCATIKYSSNNGAEKWVQRYNGPNNFCDVAKSIKVDAYNVYATGWRFDQVSGRDFITIKYSHTGSQKWIAPIDGCFNDDSAYSISMANESGDIYVTGCSYNLNNNFDYLTIKLSQNGIVRWIQFYDNDCNDDDEASYIVVDGPGNAYVTGRSKNDQGNYDYLTIKYSSSGNEEWVVRYNGPENGNDEPLAIAVDDQGYVYVTGKSDGGVNGVDYATIKYTPDGLPDWLNNPNCDENGAVRYDGPEDDIVQAMSVDDQGNIYVTGMSKSNGTGFDYATIKYDPDASSVWLNDPISDSKGAIRYDGPAHEDDGATVMVVDSQSNIYVTGYSTGSNGDTDYLTIKYTQ